MKLEEDYSQVPALHGISQSDHTVALPTPITFKGEKGDYIQQKNSEQSDPDEALKSTRRAKNLSVSDNFNTFDEEGNRQMQNRYSPDGKQSK